MKFVICFSLCFFLTLSLYAQVSNSNRIETVSAAMYQGAVDYTPKVKGVNFGFVLFQDIFSLYSIDVHFIVIPSKRMPHSVMTESIDAFLSLDVLTEEYQALLRSKFPSSNEQRGIYHKASLGTPPWPPNDKWKKLKGVANFGFAYYKSVGLDLIRIPHDKGPSLVELGRFDYFIGANEVLLALTQKTRQTSNQFIVSPLDDDDSRFFYFHPGPRGRQLKAMYDSGFETLIREGKVVDALAKSNPKIAPDKRKTFVGEYVGLIAYLKRKHPHLFKDRTVHDQNVPTILNSLK